MVTTCGRFARAGETQHESVKGDPAGVVLGAPVAAWRQRPTGLFLLRVVWVGLAGLDYWDTGFGNALPGGASGTDRFCCVDGARRDSRGGVVAAGARQRSGSVAGPGALRDRGRCWDALRDCRAGEQTDGLARRYRRDLGEGRVPLGLGAAEP